MHLSHAMKHVVAPLAAIRLALELAHLRIPRTLQRLETDGAYKRVTDQDGHGLGSVITLHTARTHRR